MLQTVGDVREGFICPQCHQDMSTMEMLQLHFQDVHMKQPSSTVKGLFSLAKQKIKSVQDNFTTNNPLEQINNYAQYFSVDSNEIVLKPIEGYSRSHTDLFHQRRKEKADQIAIETTRLLLRLERLTSTDENVPRNRNTKERRKYEQDIIAWVDESKVSLCPSCAKSFGIARRKHHCRLDGFVICNQCSQFLPFPMARYLIEPNPSSHRLCTDGMTLQRSNSLTSLTSATVGGDDSLNNSKDPGNHQEYLRICLTCRHVLQRRYDYISFQNMEKDEVFRFYEKIVESRQELIDIHPSYSTIVESLLTGDTKHQIIDAQRLYRRMSACYEKIDANSKVIAKLADNCTTIDENDTSSQIRYASLCRNLRMYAIHLLQNYAISTRRVPTEDDVKRARDERKRLLEERLESERAAKAELASKITTNSTNQINKTVVSGWKPSIDRNLLERAQDLDPLVQQIYQVTEFIREAKIAGRDEDVKSLEMNLKELEIAMNNAQQLDR